MKITKYLETKYHNYKLHMVQRRNKKRKYFKQDHRENMAYQNLCKAVIRDKVECKIYVR